MAERKKANALTELIEESRMSTMGLVESVIPFGFPGHHQHNNNNHQEGGDEEEGRGSNRFSLSFFRGGNSNKTNRLSSVASTGSRGGAKAGGGGGDGGMRGTIVTPPSSNPINAGKTARPIASGGPSAAIKSPAIKHTGASSGDVETGNNTGGAVFEVEG